MKRVNYFLVLSFVTIPAYGQEENVIPGSGNHYMDILVGVFLVAAIVLLAFSMVLLNTFKVLAKDLKNPSALLLPEKVERLEFKEWAARQKNIPGIFSKILGLKPLEQEKDLLIEHDFDGIKELDNPVPGWFNVLFYGSIAVAILYFINYEITGWGQSQEQEYASEMKQAVVEKAAFLALSANNIDESNVEASTEAGILDAGKAIYTTNCVACHGDKGQGSVGPNLTDEYWLHGGAIGSVFKTIKYGVPDKGMISWEKTLSPKQIAEVSNYILSLKGTKPANPKAPQGDKEG